MPQIHTPNLWNALSQKWHKSPMISPVPLIVTRFSNLALATTSMVKISVEVGAQWQQQKRRLASHKQLDGITFANKKYDTMSSQEVRGTHTLAIWSYYVEFVFISLVNIFVYWFIKHIYIYLYIFKSCIYIVVLNQMYIYAHLHLAFRYYIYIIYVCMIQTYISTLYIYTYICRS